MEDYLYLDDFINLYSKKYNKIIVISPYKETLKYGRIINKDKFIKKMTKVIEEYHLNKNIFNNSIKVIINKNISILDKQNIKEALEILNYKKVKFVQEILYLNMDKKKLYINYNQTYFYLYYINATGNVEIINYDNNKVNKRIIINILNLINKNKIFIYGKCALELVDMLHKHCDNYYYFEEYDNLLLNLIKKDVNYLK